MGFKKVVMLGIDAQYKEFVDGSERRDGIELEIVAEHDNPNYFFKGYQAPGDRYNIPNPRPNLHINAWRTAGAHLERADIVVFNTNPQSGVQCFPVIELADFLDSGAIVGPRKEPLPDILSDRSPVVIDNRVEPSRAARMVGFFRRYAAAAIVSALLLCVGVAVLALRSNGSWLGWAIPALFGVVVYLGAFFALYSRAAIIAHLHRQDEALENMRARISDLERLVRRN